MGPFNVCETDSDCATYKVSAKGFFSSYTQKIETGVLDGARSLIFEASKSDDVSLNPDGDSVKNEANMMMEEWHHRLSSASISMRTSNSWGKLQSGLPTLKLRK